MAKQRNKVDFLNPTLYTDDKGDWIISEPDKDGDEVLYNLTQHLRKLSKENLERLSVDSVLNIPCIDEVAND